MFFLGLALALSVNAGQDASAADAAADAAAAAAWTYEEVTIEEMDAACALLNVVGGRVIGVRDQEEGVADRMAATAELLAVLDGATRDDSRRIGLLEAGTAMEQGRATERRASLDQAVTELIAIRRAFCVS